MGMDEMEQVFQDIAPFHSWNQIIQSQDIYRW